MPSILSSLWLYLIWATGKNILPHKIPQPALKVHKHEIFFFTFLQKPNPYGPKGL